MEGRRWIIVASLVTAIAIAVAVWAGFIDNSSAWLFFFVPVAGIVLAKPSASHRDVASRESPDTSPPSERSSSPKPSSAPPPLSYPHPTAPKAPRVDPARRAEQVDHAQLSGRDIKMRPLSVDVDSGVFKEIAFDGGLAIDRQTRKVELLFASNR